MEWKDVNYGYNDKIKILQGMSPYEILEVSRDVTEENLVMSYRKKIKLYHPDLTDQFMKRYSEEISKIINNAYMTIRKERGYV